MFTSMSKKAIVFTLSSVLALGGLVGCGKKSDDTQSAGSSSAPTTSSAPSSSKPNQLSGKVTVMGSTALLPLVQAAAESYMKDNPKVTIQVSGGGSGTGLSQVEAGSVDIGDSDIFAADNQKDLVDHQVAIVPFVMVTNKDVTIKNLSQADAVKVFTGQAKNWKEVGGPDKPIVVINRPANSGTRATFQKIVLQGKDYTDGQTVQDSTQAVLKGIESTSGAIGVVAAGYTGDQDNVIAYDGVTYSPNTVKDKTYKIQSAEHMYTKGEANELEKAFIDYILSPEIQTKTVPDLKFVAIK